MVRVGSGLRRKPFGLLGVGLAMAIALLLVSSVVGASGPVFFTTPRVLGYPAGDDWEPAVASDGAGNVYVAITHIGGVPGCSGCGSGSILMQVSHDGGRTFGAPSPVFVTTAPQWDPQVRVNAAGTVFVSYMNGKDTVVQRSTDHGATWSAPVAVNVGIKQGSTDKDGLAVQGDDVYVGFDIAQRFFVASSHDGGQSFTVAQVNSKTIGWTLNGGAAVAPDGTVYLVWVVIHQSGNALGPQDVIVTVSTDKGQTWTIETVDSNLPPGPPCPTYCGWDFLGTGPAIALDQGGTVYVMYNAPLYDQGPPYMWFRTSSDGGAHWTPRVQVSTDGLPAFHGFPALDAGVAGDVRISWMDNRTGAYNVWYRSSSDGGQSWSGEVRVSQYRTGYGYVTTQGFAFPYGDYYILDLDPKGVVHIAWGEGPNWVGPGNVLYSHN